MTLEALNQLPAAERAQSMAACCGASAWIKKMNAHFPFTGKAAMQQQAETSWWQCSESDWLEAFTHHPRIGDRSELEKKFAGTALWAAAEQASTAAADNDVLDALLQGNRRYEEQFGFIFIICATGKPAAHLLQALEGRLENDPENELMIAAAQQSKITALRIEKLLS